MNKLIFTVCMLLSLQFLIKNKLSAKQNNVIENLTFKKDTVSADNSVIYKTNNLIIQKLSSHIYEHTSFLTTNDFGRVGCNGMIVINENEAIVFDTPADTVSSAELIKYTTEKLGCKIKAIIPTHFHDDCVGGLEKFNEYNIPSYALAKTIELLRNKEKKISKSINSFNDSLSLNIGDKKIYVQYFGEGHTRDNVIGYFPEDNAIFGGCLIKALGANKGNLEDANVNAWAESVTKLKLRYPSVKIVIPGHGKWGGKELLDYTITLFE